MPNQDDRLTLSDRQNDKEHLTALVALRDAEIDRLETSLADERRAGLAVRAELDRLKTTHAQLIEDQRRSTWTARLMRLFGRSERPK